MRARLLARATLMPLAFVACGNGITAQAPLPPVPAQDHPDAGPSFNPNEVVPMAAFTDFQALSAGDVQTFLEGGPYPHASFLGTYQSNGLLFSTAVANVAATYRINPIVLLVAVEVADGLVADSSYPDASSGIDYLFGCGCTVPSNPATCDTSTAGLDVQLGCYADALRTGLDQITESGTTAGGWGPGTSSTTLDGVVVTPVDASTAALYQVDPVAGTGTSGNSLFWDVWSEYTLDLSYTTPAESSAATGMVGDPCLASSDCGGPNPICATGSGYPGGMCTSKCSGSCSGAGTFCADFTAGGFCLAVCNPTVGASCREGYVCSLVKPSGAPAGTASANVCTPN